MNIRSLQQDSGYSWLHKRSWVQSLALKTSLNPACPATCPVEAQRAKSEARRAKKGTLNLEP